MRDNIQKKLLITAILLLFVSAGSMNAICLKNKEDQTLFRGDPYFILLSDYTDGEGDENLWALQLRFDIELGIVESEFDNKTLPLVTDKWVEIRIEIDLNSDWVKMYYNGSILHQKAWSAGPDNQGNGIVNISAVNLFSDSQTSVYFDDFTFEVVGDGVIWSENFDSYEDGSSIHDQGGWKGWDNNPEFTAYVSSYVNRSSPNSLEISAGSDIVRVYFGNTSGEFVYSAWMYFPENIPPDAPEITGPESGGVGSYYEYSFVSTDPDFDDVWYFIEWGDSEFEEWVGPFSSGEMVEIGHIWSEKGEYKIRAKARDSLGFESRWSEAFNVIISNPPDAPEIDGPPRVKNGVEYGFSFSAIDPDGDDVMYFIDWGNGDTEETVLYPSGSNVEIKHSWVNKGNYTIKAKAIDIYDAESNYSIFEINVPKNKAYYFKINLFRWLFERLLNANIILGKLLNL